MSAVLAQKPERRHPPQPSEFERHERMLRTYVAVLTGRLAAVDDVVQEVFLRALQRADRVVDPAGAGRFLRGIARIVVHECFRQARRSRAYVELTAESLAADDDCFEHLAANERLERLGRALRSLPLIARRMIELRYHDGFSAAAVGEVLGIRPTAVRVTLLRIRERLRREIHRA
jgi:RNA polymerase sigma-70 factor (ECF subfamily)